MTKKNFCVVVHASTTTSNHQRLYLYFVFCILYLYFYCVQNSSTNYHGCNKLLLRTATTGATIRGCESKSGHCKLSVFQFNLSERQRQGQIDRQRQKKTKIDDCKLSLFQVKQKDKNTNKDKGACKISVFQFNVFLFRVNIDFCPIRNTLIFQILDEKISLKYKINCANRRKAF